MTPSEGKHPWIAQVKSRGLGGALGLLLDVLEPLGPLGAQVLWVIQPVTSLFGGQQAIGEVAKALEEPGGVGRLRQQLDSDSLEDDNHSGDHPPPEGF